MIQQLVDKIIKTDAPIVVGLDPMLDYLPKYLLNDAYEQKGKNLEAISDAVWKFNKEIIDATYDLIPAVKPQIAMYEQFGISGLIAFVKTVDYAKSKGLIVIGDVKRGDIGSTSAAYATAHLGSITIDGSSFAPFAEDFATVNPYLGSDGILPFVEECNRSDKGIFVLVKTSNPSSGEFQDQQVDGRPLYELVGKQVEQWGQQSMDGDYSNVGAVVGATYPKMGEVLREIMPHAFILVPGYGSQGGKAEDLVPFFHQGGLGAIVNSSRGIIAAYKKEEYKQFGEKHFADASRQAVLDMIDDINHSLCAAHIK